MDHGEPQGSLDGAPAAARIARALASPTGVLVVVPLLVVVAGVAMLVLARAATREASDTMVRHELVVQAEDVSRGVAFALDQAEPMLASLRALADPDAPVGPIASRLRDLVVARPGVANVSLAFPRGLFRGTYVDDATGEVRVQESRCGARDTARTNYHFEGTALAVASTDTTHYDPRTRPYYREATRARARVWLPPHTFFTSHRTGVTIAEPIYAGDELRAVITVDFDVTALSAVIARAPVADARAIVFTGDGTVLAYPAAQLPASASAQDRLLRHEDFGDATLEALFAAIDHGLADGGRLRFVDVHAATGDYLASVAPIGGRRAGVAAPLDWYLATLVPARALLAPTWRVEIAPFQWTAELCRQRIIAQVGLGLVRGSVAVV